MNINEQFPSKYLKAADLQGRSFTMNIKHVGQEDMNGELKMILYFEGADKGMVLNKTNAFTISALYGPETDGWINKPIEVFQAMVSFNNQQVPALRVKAPSMPSHVAPNANPATQNTYQQASQGLPEQKTAPLNDPLDDEIPF